MIGVSMNTFLNSVLHPLREFSTTVLHKMSIPSAATCVSCCETVVSVYIETKTENEDLGVVEGSPIQFVGM